MNSGLMSGDETPTGTVVGSVAAGMGPAVQIASITCVTRDRVAGLRRGLSSYVENVRRFGRTNDFVVTDDSPTPATRSAYRQALSALKAEHEVEISYGGLEEKIRFAKKLIDAQAAPPEVVRFALFDSERCGLVTIGANLNAMLLHTAGDAVLSIDDDTVCRVAPAPALDERVGFASARRFSPTHPCEVYTFPDRETALRAATYTETDVLALHEQFLGRDVRQLFAEAPSAGRVAVTLNGLLGDCGWGSPLFYLLLSGDSFERLIRSEAEYRQTCTSREMWRTVQRATITAETNNMMATFFGLDNRELLPPFIPVTRGADYIFGRTVSRCCEGLFFAHLPWSLLHLPLEARTFSRGEVIRSAAGVDVDALVVALIESCPPPDEEKDTGARLKRLGGQLAELGALPEGQFDEVACAAVVREMDALVGHLEEQLTARGRSPAYWAGDAQKCVAVLRQARARRDAHLPLDLLYGHAPVEARRLTRRLVEMFGRLLYWWPELFEAARRLRAQGQRLAQPVSV
jgi:hypothetical protein